MLDSFMGVGGLLLVLAIVLFFVNPIIAIVPLLLLFALLGVKAAGGLFKHAAPAANSAGGPAVPSTREASYDPVENPAERA